MKLLPTRKPDARTAASSDDSLGRGVEIAVSVGVFFAIGFLLDNAFDTRPVFMIVLSIFSLLGSFARLWFVYDTDMKLQEVKRQKLATAHVRPKNFVGER